MFDQIFPFPSTVARHKAAPLSEERQQFLAHLARQGYKRSHLAQTASDLLRLIPAFQRVCNGLYGRAGVEAAVSRFIRERERHRPVLPYIRKTLHRLLKQWLRFFGRWKDPVPAAGPLWNLYRDFLTWLVEERGLSAGSLKNRRYSLIDVPPRNWSVFKVSPRI